MSQPICITGMHRCGTSMVAALLSKYGLSLGSSSDFMPANQSNVLGYFEHQQIAYNVNEAILTQFNGSWKNPPNLPENWFEAEDLDAVRETARSVITRLAAASTWGWKDPRTSLLIPFWESLVEDVKYIICIRNPLDVANSLEKRDGISIGKAAELWHRYIVEVLKHVPEQRRIIVDYDNFFHQPDEQIKKLVDFTGLSNFSQQLDLTKTIFNDLRHHKTTDEDLDSCEDIDGAIADLYYTLRETSRIEGSSRYTLPTSADIQAESASVETNIVFPVYEDPLVTIVIPTHNKASLLVSCLRSVLQYTDVPYKVIVIDDASTDDTPAILSNIENLTHITNTENLDFLRSVNKASELAKSKYLLLLNNDVSVRPGWLRSLIKPCENDANCGAVGAKLVSFDGRLQEAGAKVWPDGLVTLYGAGDNPFAPQYSYLRETDYCSAACLLIRLNLFRDLNALDERFVPAYYEDVDLCMSVWSAGYSVIFQPEATVFHHHMSSRPLSRVKELIECNQTKFVDKWRPMLVELDNNKNRYFAKDRYLGKRALAIISALPTSEHENGIYTQVIELARNGYAITLLPIETFYYDKEVVTEMQQAGVEVFYGTDIDTDSIINERAGQYEYILELESELNAQALVIADKLLPDAKRLNIDQIKLLKRESS